MQKSEKLFKNYSYTYETLSHTSQLMIFRFKHQTSPASFRNINPTSLRVTIFVRSCEITDDGESGREERPLNPCERRRPVFFDCSRFISFANSYENIRARISACCIRVKCHTDEKRDSFLVRPAVHP